MSRLNLLRSCFGEVPNEFLVAACEDVSRPNKVYRIPQRNRSCIKERRSKKKENGKGNISSIYSSDALRQKPSVASADSQLLRPRMYDSAKIIHNKTLTDDVTPAAAVNTMYADVDCVHKNRTIR